MLQQGVIFLHTSSRIRGVPIRDLGEAKQMYYKQILSHSNTYRSRPIFVHESMFFHPIDIECTDFEDGVRLGLLGGRCRRRSGAACVYSCIVVGRICLRRVGNKRHATSRRYFLSYSYQKRG